jgi:hypothetical protein
MKEMLSRVPNKLSSEDQSYLLASTWTLDQIPEITGAAEYQRYLELLEEMKTKLDVDLPSRDSPEWGSAFLANMRTPGGCS